MQNVKNLYKAYLINSGELNCQFPIGVTFDLELGSGLDGWLFYLDQMRTKFPFRAIFTPYFRYLGRAGVLFPSFPFQGQFFFSSPGRNEARSTVWNRHPVSKLLFKLFESKQPSLLSFLKKSHRLVRFVAQTSISQQLCWRSLLAFQILNAGFTGVFFFEFQRKFDLIFHPWIFSCRSGAFYSDWEKKFLDKIFFTPGFCFPTLPGLRLPHRFRKRFYYSIWFSHVFSWTGRSNFLFYRSFPNFLPAQLANPNLIWLKQRPGVP